MSVRCNRIVSPTTGEEMATSPWLTVGREYDVLEVVSEPGREVLLRVVTDESASPGLWDSRLFTTVETHIPRTWSVVVHADGSVTLGPTAWRSPGFWESYFDGDSEAVREYELVVETLHEH